MRTLGIAHEGQAGAVLAQVEVQSAVTVHDHAFARSLSVIHRGQAVAVHAVLRVHHVVQEIIRIADRVIGSVHDGLLAGLHESAEIDDTRLERHLVGDTHLGNPLLGHDQVRRRTGIVYHFDVVHLRTRIWGRGGGLGAERQAGEQSHGKEHDLFHTKRIWVLIRQNA